MNKLMITLALGLFLLGAEAGYFLLPSFVNTIVNHYTVKPLPPVAHTLPQLPAPKKPRHVAPKLIPPPLSSDQGLIIDSFNAYTEALTVEENQYLGAKEKWAKETLDGHPELKTELNEVLDLISVLRTTSNKDDLREGINQLHSDVEHINDILENTFS